MLWHLQLQAGFLGGADALPAAIELRLQLDPRRLRRRRRSCRSRHHLPHNNNGVTSAPSKHSKLACDLHIVRAPKQAQISQGRAVGLVLLMCSTAHLLGLDLCLAPQLGLLLGDALCLVRGVLRGAAQLLLQLRDPRLRCLPRRLFLLP